MENQIGFIVNRIWFMYIEFDLCKSNLICANQIWFVQIKIPFFLLQHDLTINPIRFVTTIWQYADLTFFYVWHPIAKRVIKVDEFKLCFSISKSSKKLIC